MKTGKSKQTVLAATAASLLVQHAYAGSQSAWNVATTGNWSLPTNWTPNLVPGASSATDALVNSGGIANVDSNYTLTNLDLNSGGISGNVGSSLTASGQFHWVGGSVSAGATITANGSAVIGNGVTPLANIGTIRLNVTPASTLTVPLSNAGTITLGANTTLELGNGSTTAGRYLSGATSSLLRFSYDQAGGGDNVHQLTGSVTTAGDVEVVDADFSIASGSTVTARDTRFTGVLAVLRGNGTIAGPVEFNNTTIYAGDNDAVGTLSVGGNVSLTNVTQLNNDITAASGNDSLQITGSASVNNLLLLASLSDGSTPAVNQRFVILNALGGVLGDRSTMIDPDSYVDGYVPAYNSSDPNGQTGGFNVEITATQIALVYVPEPTLVMPIAAGLIALRRRRTL